MGLTNAQYNTIMRDYQRQQALDQRELAARTEEVYGRFPELSRIDAGIASAGTACARRLLTDGSGSLEELRAEISGLSAQKAEILRKAGYPEDYLSLRYRCPDCQDTGYIGTERCHCFRQAAIDLLYTQSNLREILKKENFSAFSLDYYSDHFIDPLTGLSSLQTARRALSECRRFVQDFDHVFRNIFLYGDTGLGKTFLAHCIAKELLETAHSVVYFSSFGLFELFAGSAFGKKEPSGQPDMGEHIFDCDLLIIDDLGTELVNSFVCSELFHVLNERIQHRKSTLISTNLALQTFADTYSERVFSRISSNYTMIKMVGDDIRLKIKFSSTGA